MTNNTEPTIDTLKANILTEFKQVLKLAPADYTENCTNVVMSLVDEYVADQVAKAMIDELEHLFDRADGERSARRYTAILEQRIKVLRTRLNGVKNNG